MLQFYGDYHVSTNARKLVSQRYIFTLPKVVRSLLEIKIDASTKAFAA